MDTLYTTSPEQQASSGLVVLDQITNPSGSFTVPDHLFGFAYGTASYNSLTLPVQGAYCRTPGGTPNKEIEYYWGQAHYTTGMSIYDCGTYFKRGTGSVKFILFIGLAQ